MTDAAQLPVKVAILETQMADVRGDIAEIKKDSSEIKEMFSRLSSYIEQDKGKSSAGRYIGHLISASIGGVVAAIGGHIKFN